MSAYSYSLPPIRERVKKPSLDLPWAEDVIALRRDFHEHPEIGFEEHRTAKIVAERLKELGLEIRTGIGGTGVVARLRGAHNGPTVLVRADMDALPIQETTDWEWKSKNEGLMHACGHDAHTAIGLSAARLLSEKQSDLKGDVLFVFQPAEEGLGGAGRMLEDQIWSKAEGIPDFALALHVWSPLEAGHIAVSAGPVMAAADEFRATIIGRGGHAALPHETIDPIVIAAQIVTALQSVVARNVKPLDAAVFSVTKIEGGTAFNIIPDEVRLQGTLRSFEPEVRDLLAKRGQEIVEQLSRALGGRGEWQFLAGYPATVNDSAIVERVRPAFERVAGKENVVEFEPTLGAEDMSLLLQEIPGCYFFIGARSEKSQATFAHHHPQFNIDESALHLGTGALVEAVYGLLS